MKKLIIFLIRKRLGLGKRELFQDECRNSIRTDILLGGSSSYGH